MGEYQASINYAKKVIGLDSKRVDCFILLAESYMNLKKEEEELSSGDP